MKKKLIGTIICILLLSANVLPVTGMINKEEPVENNSKINNVPIKPSISPGDHFQFIRIGWQLRSYRIHIPPSYDGTTLMPLVLSFHGFTSNSISNAMMTNFSAKADEEGFIAVFPNGATDLLFLTFCRIFLDRFGRYWNAGFCCGNAVKRDINDVGFVQELIKKLQKNINIDTNRIYVTGMSNGGMMSHRLGAEFSDIIAAIAPVTGTIGGKYKDNPPYIIPDPENPVSVIIIHGTKDPLVPYDGNDNFLSVNDSVSFWVDHNNCDEIPQINISESGNIIKRTYSNGSDNTEVVLYTVVDGGHYWFGSEYFPQSEISATDLIWDFFTNHPKS
jgi:polyhydroxybutyrate depolymerase